MLDETFLQSLGLILIAAAICALLARRLGLPGIVAYIVAGIALGPLTGLLERNEALDTISEAGIVLLLFLVGLELTAEKIRNLGRNAALAGGFQIALTAPPAFALAAALGFPTIHALVIAIGLTLSSTVVVVKGLVERKAASTLAGQTALGILLVQDLFVIVLLTIIAGLGDAGAENLDASTILTGAGSALAKMALVIVVLFIIARMVLPRAFNWARRSRETVFIASITWCFLVVSGVHLLHLSAEIGAFLAGVSLAQLPHTHDLARRVTPLMNGFVAVFFVTLGAGVALPSEGSFWLKALAFSVFVLCGKFMIVAVVTRLLKFHARPAFDTSLMLTQISEFSFIFAAAATAAGLADGAVGTMLAVVGLVTITISSISGLIAPALYQFYRRTPFAPKSGVHGDDQNDHAPPEGGHIIIVGMNTLGRELVQRLHSAGHRVLAIDTSPAKLEGLPCRCLEGDASSPPVLDDAGLSNAEILVSTLHITDTNELLAFRAKAAGVPSAIHAPDVRRTAKLLELGAEYVMAPKVDSLKVQRDVLNDLGLLETPR